MRDYELVCTGFKPGLKAVLNFKPIHGLNRWLLQAFFDNRKERIELLKALVVNDKDAVSPNYTQVYSLLIINI